MAQDELYPIAVLMWVHERDHRALQRVLQPDLRACEPSVPGASVGDVQHGQKTFRDGLWGYLAARPLGIQPALQHAHGLGLPRADGPLNP